MARREPTLFHANGKRLYPPTQESGPDELRAFANDGGMFHAPRGADRIYAYVDANIPGRNREHSNVHPQTKGDDRATLAREMLADLKEFAKKTNWEFYNRGDDEQLVWELSAADTRMFPTDEKRHAVQSLLEDGEPLRVGIVKMAEIAQVVLAYLEATDAPVTVLSKSSLERVRLSDPGLVVDPNAEPGFDDESQTKIEDELATIRDETRRKLQEKPKKLLKEFAKTDPPAPEKYSDYRQLCRAFSENDDFTPTDDDYENQQARKLHELARAFDDVTTATVTTHPLEVLPADERSNRRREILNDLRTERDDFEDEVKPELKRRLADAVDLEDDATDTDYHTLGVLLEVLDDASDSRPSPAVSYTRSVDEPVREDVIEAVVEHCRTVRQSLPLDEDEQTKLLEEVAEDVRDSREQITDERLREHRLAWERLRDDVDDQIDAVESLQTAFGDGPVSEETEPARELRELLDRVDNDQVLSDEQKRDFESELGDAVTKLVDDVRDSEESRHRRQLQDKLGALADPERRVSDDATLEAFERLQRIDNARRVLEDDTVQVDGVKGFRNACSDLFDSDLSESRKEVVAEWIDDQAQQELDTAAADAREQAEVSFENLADAATQPEGAEEALDRLSEVDEILAGERSDVDWNDEGLAAELSSAVSTFEREKRPWNSLDNQLIEELRERLSERRDEQEKQLVESYVEQFKMGLTAIKSEVDTDTKLGLLEDIKRSIRNEDSDVDTAVESGPNLKQMQKALSAAFQSDCLGQSGQKELRKELRQHVESEQDETLQTRSEEVSRSIRDTIDNTIPGILSKNTSENYSVDSNTLEEICAARDDLNHLANWLNSGGSSPDMFEEEIDRADLTPDDQEKLKAEVKDKLSDAEERYAETLSGFLIDKVNELLRGQTGWDHLKLLYGVRHQIETGIDLTPEMETNPFDGKVDEVIANARDRDSLDHAVEELEKKHKAKSKEVIKNEVDRMNEALWRATYRSDSPEEKVESFRDVATGQSSDSEYPQDDEFEDAMETYRGIEEHSKLVHPEVDCDPEDRIDRNGYDPTPVDRLSEALPRRVVLAAPILFVLAVGVFFVLMTTPTGLTLPGSTGVPFGLGTGQPVPQATTSAATQTVTTASSPVAAASVAVTADKVRFASSNETELRLAGEVNGSATAVRYVLNPRGTNRAGDPPNGTLQVSNGTFNTTVSVTPDRNYTVKLAAVTEESQTQPPDVIVNVTATTTATDKSSENSSSVAVPERVCPQPDPARSYRHVHPTHTPTAQSENDDSPRLRHTRRQYVRAAGGLR